MTNDWYKIVHPAEKLTQGDFIVDCPLATWKEEIDLSGESEIDVLKASTDFLEADVVVMTQACDLDQNKVKNVILCPHISIEDFKKQWINKAQSSGETDVPNKWKSYSKQICKKWLR